MLTGSTYNLISGILKLNYAAIRILWRQMLTMTSWVWTRCSLFLFFFSQQKPTKQHSKKSTNPHSLYYLYTGSWFTIRQVLAGSVPVTWGKEQLRNCLPLQYLTLCIQSVRWFDCAVGKHSTINAYLAWILLTKLHLVSHSLDKLLLLCTFFIL